MLLIMYSNKLSVINDTIIFRLNDFMKKHSILLTEKLMAVIVWRYQSEGKLDHMFKWHQLSNVV